MDNSDHKVFVANAHRKLHQPVRLPAVARHLAFKKDSSDVDESKWVDKIERLIISIFQGLEEKCEGKGFKTSISNLQQPPEDAERIGRNQTTATTAVPVELIKRSYWLKADGVYCTKLLPPVGNRYETVVISSTWKGLPALFRFELFEEYFSLSIFLEFHSTELGVSPDRTQTDAMATLITGLNEKYQIKQRVSQNSPAGIASDFSWQYFLHESGAATSLNFFLDTIWDEFDTFLYEQKNRGIGLDINYPPNQGMSIIPLAPAWEIEPFADFRGFLLGLSGPDRLKGIATDFSSPNPNDGDVLFPKRLYPSEILATEKSRLDHTSLVFPLLLKNRPQRRQRRFESFEYTWSTFENNTVLYGSCLGRSSSIPNGGALDYVLVFNHDDDRSVGRVAGRLHTLGTVRVAALLDFDRILIRDTILSSIDLELSRIDATEKSSDLPRQIHESFLRLVDRSSRFPEEARIRAKAIRANPMFETQASALLARLPGHANNLIEFFNNNGQRLDDKNCPVSIYKDAAEILKNYYTDLTRLIAACQLALGTDGAPAVLTDRERSAWRFIRSEAKQISREIDNVRDSETIDKFKKRNIKDIQHALESMNDQLKFGLNYRSERSRYHRGLFEALVEAMDVKGVPGFQKYDEFVRHRLYRSYSMIEAVRLKHATVSQRLSDVKRRIDSSDNERWKEHIYRIQLFGEIALVCVIVPHYLADSFESAGHNIAQRLSNLTDMSIEPKILMFFIAAAFSCAIWLISRNRAAREGIRVHLLACRRWIKERIINFLSRTSE